MSDDGQSEVPSVPKVVSINKGLDLAVKGEPSRAVDDGPVVDRVAVLGTDYAGMKPSFYVKVGDHVKKGQLLFTDRKMPRIRYTSPGSGKIVAINRGLRRVFQSLVIELDYDFEELFTFYSEKELSTLDREAVQKLLLESGEWTALRQRPFGKVADPDVIPNSIFIKCVDTDPLAPSLNPIIQGKGKDLINGVKVISRLTNGKTFLTKAPQVRIPNEIKKFADVVVFEGPHPSGNVGTHIHFLDPVHKDKAVWHINFQDVIAIGKLFTTGKIHLERIISLAGPCIENPRLVRSRIGASIEQLVVEELAEPAETADFEEQIRTISGSILNGHTATGPFAFLGRYHQQVCALLEGNRRELLGWLNPGWNKFSIKPAFLSKLSPKKKFKFNTSLNGSERAMVPIGMYEKVMPLDILPTFLLRALLSHDLEKAEELGCLELDEEDLALCSVVSPGKEEFGPILKGVLNLIESEG